MPSIAIMDPTQFSAAAGEGGSSGPGSNQRQTGLGQQGLGGWNRRQRSGALPAQWCEHPPAPARIPPPPCQMSQSASVPDVTDLPQSSQSCHAHAQCHGVQLTGRSVQGAAGGGHPPDTGFLKKRTDDTTTATRFIVLPTLKVTGEMFWSSTM